MTDLQAGSPAPDFELPASGGNRVSLNALKGRRFVLYFYPKDATEGCSAEAASFERLKPDFDRAGVTLLGVSPDSLKSHDRFAEKLGLTFPLLSDENQEAANAFGVWIEKKMYGRVFWGVERATFLVGDDGRILRVWRKVRVPGHAEDVLEAAKNPLVTAH